MLRYKVPCDKLVPMTGLVDVVKKITKTEGEILDGAPVKGDFDDSLDVEDSELRIYELGYHIIPSIAEEAIPAEVSFVRTALEENDGTVISDSAPSQITLAYTMSRTENGKKEKFDTAHFGSIKFEMVPQQVLALKEKLDTNKNILRYIIFKTVKENTRSEIRIPIVKDEKKPAPVAKPIRKPEVRVPISEEELDRTIEKLVVE